MAALRFCRISRRSSERGMHVRRVPSEAPARERATWLAELSQALIEAQRLTWDLGFHRGNWEAMELYERIEAALADVQVLRLSRSAGQSCYHELRTSDPLWPASGERTAR